MAIKSMTRCDAPQSLIAATIAARISCGDGQRQRHHSESTSARDPSRMMGRILLCPNGSSLKRSRPFSKTLTRLHLSHSLAFGDCELSIEGYQDDELVPRARNSLHKCNHRAPGWLLGESGCAVG